jgi:GT2 family glycosyltransferase
LQLSVIIVNYNVKYFAEQCLYTVINASKNIAAEIILIDNNSTDGSREFFNGKFTNVHFIWSNANVGFSKANNIALQQSRGKYILFLNPDTLVPEDCFEKCISFFESAKDIGALGIRMIDGTGKFLKESKRGFPTLLTSFFKLSGLAGLFPNSKIFASYYAGYLSENQNHTVDVLAGAFMMVDKKMIDRTRGFDEDFFMYGEDIDLSYRVQKAGYKNYYFSGSTIIHFKGESTKKETVKYVQVFYGAMKLFVIKHYSKTRAGLYSIFIQTAVWLKMIFLFIKRVLLSFKKNQKETNVSAVATLIVAAENEYPAVIDLLKDAGLNWFVIGRIEPGKIDNSNALGSLKDLPELTNRFAIKKMVFCIGELSVKEITNVLQNTNLRVSYLFHTAGSTSIVGSNDKNKTGDYIAVE